MKYLFLCGHACINARYHTYARCWVSHVWHGRGWTHRFPVGGSCKALQLVLVKMGPVKMGPGFKLGYVIRDHSSGPYLTYTLNEISC